jgi:hypothetical protein
MITTIKNKIQEQLTDFTIQDGSGQRTIGDLLEFKVIEILKSLKDDNLINEYVEARSKKSVEDISLIGNDIHHYVDIKTHNLDLDFSMPNLTSIEKLREILLDENKSLIYVFISYKIQENLVIINNVEVKYIWNLDFSILRIGSLGRGQLQIKNMNNELIFNDDSKLTWFEKLKKVVNLYHDSRIKKIEKEKKLWT